jgi:hypothetical protein
LIKGPKRRFLAAATLLGGFTRSGANPLLWRENKLGSVE